MRDIATKSIGAKFYYQDCNAMAMELENLVTTSGQILNEADNYQVTKAVATYNAVGNFYTDTGTADHYVLNVVGSHQIPIAYEEGMSVRFRAANSNTGTSDVNVAGLGLKTIKKEGGIFDLTAGDIPAGQIIEIIYNAATGFFELYSHKYQDDISVTGMVVGYPLYVTLPGWIPYSENNTIGSTASAAVTHDDATRQLFLLYWSNAYVTLSPGGKGASALDDWNANKVLTFPPVNGRVFANAAWTANSGQIVGETQHTLSINELTQHNHIYQQSNTITRGIGGGGDTSYMLGYSNQYVLNTGSSVAFNIMQPTSYLFYLIKL